MAGKKVIKVVKKAQRNPPKSTTSNKGAREAAREMVQTVTNWVDEFQQKRRVETSGAIKSLFADSPRPSEA